MELIEAIVDLCDTASEAAPLRALLTGGLAADSDWDNRIRPYGIVTESTFDVEVRGHNQSYEVETQTIQFQIFTDTRAECVAILDALEAAYMPTTLTTTGRECLGPPTIDDRLIQNLTDCYRGILNLAYMLQK